MFTEKAAAGSALADQAGAGRRLLLICPDFFSYHTLIAAELRDLGYEVTHWSDRVSGGTIYKVMLRRMPGLTGRLTARNFINRIKTLPENAFDDILIVKGEGLSRPVMDALQARFPQARIACYLWDAVANVRNALVVAPYAAYVGTFDPDDARRYGWTYRPLFAKPQGNVPERAEFEYDWCFIGTIHSDRARVIRRFRTANPMRKGFVFGFFPSKALKIAYSLRDPAIRFDPQGSASLVPMPAAKTAAIIRTSRSVIDIEHPNQIGLTIRSIETLLSGRKLITTNQTIASSPLAGASRVAVIDRTAPQVPDAFFETAFEPLPADVIYHYSITCWARDVMGLPHPTAPQRG